ncbi:MAG TPA: hypothetical protein VJ987_13175 [Anaerolineales bacterium]|nr:hypothetical protein [Anaerolineales bacterium]
MTPARQRRLILGLILIGFLIASFFGLRAMFALREFRKHGGPPPLAEAIEKSPEEAEETDVELIRDWMTVPYIGMTYHVHPKTLFDALGISPRENEEKSLLQLNEEFFPDQPGVVIELIKDVVQANQPVPTAIVTDTSPGP